MKKFEINCEVFKVLKNYEDGGREVEIINQLSPRIGGVDVFTVDDETYFLFMGKLEESSNLHKQAQDNAKRISKYMNSNNFSKPETFQNKCNKEDM